MIHSQFRLAFLVFLFASLFISCKNQEKIEPVPLGETVVYQDPISHFAVSYPSSWVKSSEPGKRFTAYSTQSTVERFVPPYDRGTQGSRIQVTAIAGRKLAAAIADFKDEMKDVATLGAEEQMVIAGVPATKISYTLALEDGTFKSFRIFTENEGYVTLLDCAGIGGYFDAEAARFANAVQSLKPASSKKEAVKAEETAASSQLEMYNGPMFSIGYPSNFDQVSAKKTGTSLASVSIRGLRADCAIQVDAFPTKVTDLDKIIETNKATYKSNSVGSTTIDGVPAKYISYSPVKGVNSRAYFVVKGDKFYRITLNWHQASEANYLPAFEKTVASFKIK